MRGTARDGNLADCAGDPYRAPDGDVQTAEAKQDGTASVNGDGTRTSLFFCGLNAHGQLIEWHDGDLRSFYPEAPCSTQPKVLFAGWSTVAIRHTNHLKVSGHQKLLIPLDVSKPKLISAFGDHNGLIGCLDVEGGLYVLPETTSAAQQPASLVRHGDDESPHLSHVALAGNDRIAVTFMQAPDARLTHVVEFDDLKAFLRWHSDPSASCPANHYMLPGRPKQVLAGTGTFIILMEGGEVYTWGDPRYRSLGRSTTGEGAVSAARPGVVEALGGLKISRVSCGGWQNAALSEDGALYAWGVGNPGTDQTIKCLKDAAAGEVVLVDVTSDDHQVQDIADVSVGDNHMVTVNEDGRLYVVGDNANGQLGVASDEPFFEDWKEVENPRLIHTIVCGPKATFLTVEEP